MIKLLKRIWNSEPVILVGALTAAWIALVAADQLDDTWAISTRVYIVAVPVAAFLTAITRSRVEPSDDR